MKKVMNMDKKHVAVSAIILLICIIAEVNAQNNINHLVRNLLAIGYPLSKEDVLALDKISMRFDSRNRIDVLKKILTDRERIHNIEGAEYYSKTEAVCDALRLLDEHNLPATDALIKKLSRQKGWKIREKTLLTFMAAKRDIDYQSNVANLMNALQQYSISFERLSEGEISVAILDVCNSLGYLAELFNIKGGKEILNVLIKYASSAYGYPVEYLSHLLVDMFIQRPKAFVSSLAAKDTQTINLVVNSTIFGIWNDRVREKIREVLQSDLSITDNKEKYVITQLTDKLNSETGNTIGN